MTYIEVVSSASSSSDCFGETTSCFGVGSFPWTGELIWERASEVEGGMSRGDGSTSDENSSCQSGTLHFQINLANKNTKSQ